MGKNTPLVEMMQGIQSTQTTNPKYYWLNLVSPRLGCLNSTPYETLAEAEEMLNAYLALVGKAFGYQQIAPYRWKATNGTTISIDDNGDMLKHLQDELQMWLIRNAPKYDEYGS